MRANPTARPYPSRRAHARATLRKRLRVRAPQDEDSIAFQSSPRCQTAHLVPAAHFCARGFATLLHSPRNEGWAERRETFGRVRSTRGACHLASKTRVNALMTRHT